ncbi:hypothetical protein NUU61_001173 [Penicillium alfredii]|uniref:Uncharacterized protein n=1 Tax=Penicillium alfredii TaxID=1506179 RepID=A0A9W9GBH7_9EURO|nr:uncharacterized protein NUU61_001173 [Penicillium alfredii]KAJ5115414.1 hypothetical protein NUU61_001173 [Penicillium alfredii]
MVFGSFERDVSMSRGSDELLTHRDTAEPVARFMVRTGLLGQSREVDDAAMGRKPAIRRRQDRPAAQRRDRITIQQGHSSRTE